MIKNVFNSKFESIFNPRNIDDDCCRIGGLIDKEGELIKDALTAGLYKQAVTQYLQLLKSMAVHFVEDEHYCYFDDMYSPEYSLRSIYDEIRKYEIGEEEQMLLDVGHSEIMDSECYQEYGYPSYI